MVLSMCELYLFSLPAMMIIQSRNQGSVSEGGGCRHRLVSGALRCERAVGCAKAWCGRAADRLID